MNIRQKLVIIITLISGYAGGLLSQTCQGNLGENIFLDGNFGSGTANVLTTNPQIAPGYDYTTNPPPNDGFYTITNNTANWNLFNAWLGIKDNSNDPNGYMMVVNASFNPGLFYEQEVTGLCENTLYEFSADIINLINIGANFIKPNVSFLIDGAIIYSTGNIPENEQWNTYGFTFTTDPGQTSVILSLQNNAAGGTGNDLAIDNITFRPCGPEALILPTDIANICEDGNPIDLAATVVGNQYDTIAFQWQQSFDDGITWVNIIGENDSIYTHTDLSGGLYYYRYLIANGTGNLNNSKCRIVSNIKIINVVPKFYNIIDTLCEGLVYEVGNNNYSNTGIYVDSLLSSIGCDSIITLDLTIVPDEGIEVVFDVDNPSCTELNNGSIFIESITNGTPPYSFVFDGEPIPIANTISDLLQGEYTVVVSDYFGCSFESIIELQTPQSFFIDLGPNVTLNLGESVQITPSTNFPIENFSWTPEGSIECTDDCWELNWAPPNSIMLSLTATSVDDCIASDSVFIEVIKVRNVFIPNAFSPNSDGLNDSFTIFGAIPNVQRILYLKIFDRWGGLVYDQKDFLPNDPLSGWDGIFNGKALDSGTFAYLAEILFLDGEKDIYSGDIILIK